MDHLPRPVMFLSILANLNNAVVWMILANHLISNSSRHLTKPLGFIQSTPITIGIILTYYHYYHYVFFSDILLYIIEINGIMTQFYRKNSDNIRKAEHKDWNEIRKTTKIWVLILTNPLNNTFNFRMSNKSGKFISRNVVFKMKIRILIWTIYGRVIILFVFILSVFSEKIIFFSF